MAGSRLIPKLAFRSDGVTGFPAKQCGRVARPAALFYWLVNRLLTMYIDYCRPGCASDPVSVLEAEQKYVVPGTGR